MFGGQKFQRNVRQTKFRLLQPVHDPKFMQRALVPASGGSSQVLGHEFNPTPSTIGCLSRFVLNWK